jgi:miniconductance mechanosensitive channel
MIENALSFLKEFLGANTLLFALIVFVLVLFIGIALYWIAYFLIIRIVQRISKTLKSSIADILIRRKVIKRACYFIVTVIFFKTNDLIFSDFPAWQGFFHRLLAICNVYIFVLFIISSFWAIAEYYAKKRHAHLRPMKGLMQFVTLIVYGFGAIIILSLIFNKSPMVMVGSLSALSAVLMLVFKDSLLGLVAGIRLSSNDMVRIGDWITIEKFGADGDVTDITLTTVKVRNFDNTIVTIPAYSLISESVVNWREMQESGMRRIRRAIFLDSTKIFPLTEKYKANVNKTFLKDIENEMPETNIGLFRLYATWYLKQRSDISKKGTLMVRQKDIKDLGIPLEIYCFTNTSVWSEYERIQTEIFEHLFAVIPAFGMGVYQRSGKDDERYMLAQ